MKDVPRITDAQWQDIEKTLPASADRISVRTRLEQIAQAKLSPEQLALQCDEVARQCEKLAQVLRKGHAFIEQLSQCGDVAKQQAVFYRQIGKVPQPHFLRQCQLLYLWETIGGNLKITTPRRTEIWRATHETTKSPPPHGLVIQYFQAVAKAVFGKTPTPWQIKKIVSAYKKLKFSAAMEAALKSSQLCAAFGIPFTGQLLQLSITIDQSQIFILREGKMLKAGEENLPENQPEVLRAARERKEPP